MTVGNLFEESIRILTEAGIDDARSDVCVIFDELCESHDSDSELPSDLELKIKSAINRRKTHEPVAYILGVQCFYKSKFNVNPNVLIPRSDTELLVETALKFAGKLDFPMGDVLKVNSTHFDAEITFADWCTGSGCIGISISKELGNSLKKCDLVEVSEAAIDVTRSNVSSDISDKVEIIKSDIFAYDVPEGKYDFIVSNPPYITHDEMLELDIDVDKFEPHLALEADDNGLAFYKVICDKAMVGLKPGGMLAVEHGYLQGRSVREIFENSNFNDVFTLKDFGGNDRVTLGIKS